MLSKSGLVIPIASIHLSSDQTDTFGVWWTFNSLVLLVDHPLAYARSTALTCPRAWLTLLSLYWPYLFWEMNSLQDVDGLSECIGRAIEEHLSRSNINLAWPQLDSLNRPILRIEAFLEDAGPLNGSKARSDRVASVCLNTIYSIIPSLPLVLFRHV